MEMIMSNPTEREWIRMRRDAEIDRRSEIKAAERNGERNANLKTAKNCKDAGIDLAVIAKVTGLSLAEVEAL